MCTVHFRQRRPFHRLPWCHGLSSMWLWERGVCITVTLRWLSDMLSGLDSILIAWAAVKGMWRFEVGGNGLGWSWARQCTSSEDMLLLYWCWTLEGHCCNALSGCRATDAWKCNTETCAKFIMRNQEQIIHQSNKNNHAACIWFMTENTPWCQRSHWTERMMSAERDSYDCRTPDHHPNITGTSGRNQRRTLIPVWSVFDRICNNVTCSASEMTFLLSSMQSSGPYD